MFKWFKWLDAAYRRDETSKKMGKVQCPYCKLYVWRLFDHYYIDYPTTCGDWRTHEQVDKSKKV